MVLQDVPKRKRIFDANMEDLAPPASPSPTTSREKTSPFLIRAFIKIGGFHRLSQFEDGTLISTPTASSANLPNPDEQQIFTWKDATLREILTTLRSTAPQTAEYRHPLARYSFRSIYFDSHASSSRREGGKMGGGGRFASKDLGIVYSRDILGDPGSISGGIAPRLLEEYEADAATVSAEGAGNKTLEELKFVPGDFLCVAVLLPKNVTVASGTSGEFAAKGGPGGAAAGTAPANGWKTAGPRGGDGGWGGPVSAFGGGGGRGSGGHWRGESNGPSGLGRGRGGSRRDRDDDFRRFPPPRRDSSSPRRSGRGAGGGGGRRRSRSSRSRSPRRNPRYD